MKIGGANAHSINFIEQKKSTATTTSKKDIEDSRVDSFVGKSTSMSALIESNDSIAMLQITSDSISKLKNSSEELQKLNDKFTFFPSQEDDLKQRFEGLTLDMLDVVDNSMFKGKSLFYEPQTVKAGETEFTISALQNNPIEDFTLGTSENIDNFVKSLESSEEQISSVKSYVEVANFNQVASLNVENFTNPFQAKSENTAISLEDIKQAHNTSLPDEDRVSFLLRG